MAMLSLPIPKPAMLMRQFAQPLAQEIITLVLQNGDRFKEHETIDRDSFAYLAENGVLS